MKKLFVILLALAMTLALAACGSKTAEPTTTEAPAETTEAAATEAPAETADTVDTDDTADTAEGTNP